MKSHKEVIFKTAHISAEQIDKRRTKGTNLNEIEISYAIRSLKFLKKKLESQNVPISWNIIYLDALSDPVTYIRRR